MPRITDEQLSKLKNDISLVRLIESQGYSLKKEGKDQVMCCPFHDDDTPSLKVSVSKNVFNCFGCGQSGTVIDWVMQTQGVSFRHACEILIGGGELDTGTKKVNSVPKLKSPVNDQTDNQTVLNQVIDYYHESLKQTPEALSYLASRGLSHPELINEFKLGFANRTLGIRLPAKNREAGKLIRSQLQEVGILRTSGHEHFNGSIVVPIFDEHENVVECYGRKIRNNLRKGTPKHLYLPGPHSGIWNQQSLVLSDEVILCESLIDAMTFWVHGFKNVTSSYGTGGFTSELLEAFKHNGIKRVLIAYDRDDAGNGAAEKLVCELTSSGMDAFRVLFPKNMDANEYALNVQPAAMSLGIAIRKAEWLGKGKAPQITTALSELEKIKKLAGEHGCSTAAGAGCTGVVKKVSKLPSIDSPSQPEPSAKVIPKTTKELDAEITDHEVNISMGKRSYRIRGLAKNMSYEQLKVNVMVSLNDAYHLDTLDMYSSKARAGYIKQASIELGVSNDTIKKDLGQILVKLEELQEQQIKSKLSPSEQPEVSLSEDETCEAMALLKNPDLLDQILCDFQTAGVVGERSNKLVGYLACVSRKLDKPLAIIIQSSSAAGKSSLMDAILKFMPAHEQIQYSAITGQSLFYMGETSLKHKILAIAEEEGAHNASYALKLLQSEGELTIASTGKDEATGNMETKQYHVQGPVMLFLTTTAIDIDEELMNRCLVLTVNESREQTRAIHEAQRKSQTIEGLLQLQDKAHIIKVHQNAMSLIKPLKVANPYAEQLTFIDDKTRTRRDHMKYLTLIQSITLLHQYQRDIKTVNHNGEVIKYIEVTKGDIQIANKLAHEVLGKSLDELPPQTRTLLKHIHQMVNDHCQKEALSINDYRFTRRDVRAHVGWTDFQVRKHMTRLQEMEYLLVHRGGRGQSFVYELLYQGEADKHDTFVLGLKNMENLNYDEKNEPLKGNNKRPKSPQSAGNKPQASGDKITPKPGNSGLKDKESSKLVENVLLGEQKSAVHPVVPAH